MKNILKNLNRFIRSLFSRKPKPTPVNADTTPVKYTLVDSYESVITAFKILEGPYKDVVFSIVKITPKEENDHLNLTYLYEIIQSPVPAETIESQPEFTRVIENIISDILYNTEDTYETSIANNPWLTNIE